MTPHPKALALASVVGAGISDAMLWAIAQAKGTEPSTPISMLAGGLGGALGAAVMWGIYKQKVDALEKQMDRKADQHHVDAMAELLKEVRDDVKWIIKRNLEET